MRAAVYHGRADVRVEQVPDPAPAPGEVVLQVAATGICGTDAHEFAHGPSMFPVLQRHPVTGHLGPLIPGHEIAGRVVARGEGAGAFSDGELVVTAGGMSCGSCRQCRSGRTNLCDRYATIGLQRDGGLAQYCAVPEDICVSVEAQALSGDAAALAQPMAIATHALRRGGIRPGEDTVIVGAGGIGAFLCFAAAQSGARVVVADRDAGRLRIAEALGAHVTVEVGDDPRATTDALRDASALPTVVFEVSGSASGLDTALDLLPAGGRLVVVGLQGRPREMDLRGLALREHEVIGTNALVFREDLPEAVVLLAARSQGWQDVAPLALPLDQLVEDGLRPLAEGRSPRIKTLIDPWASKSRPTRMHARG